MSDEQVKPSEDSATDTWFDSIEQPNQPDKEVPDETVDDSALGEAVDEPVVNDSQDDEQPPVDDTASTESTEWDKTRQAIDQLTSTLQQQLETKAKSPDDVKIDKKIEKTKTRIRELADKAEFVDASDVAKATDESIEQLRAEITDEFKSELQSLRAQLQAQQATRAEAYAFNQEYPELVGRYEEFAQKAYNLTNENKDAQETSDEVKAFLDRQNLKLLASQAAQQLNAKAQVDQTKSKPKRKPINTNPVKTSSAPSGDSSMSPIDFIGKLLGE